MAGLLCLLGLCTASGMAVAKQAKDNHFLPFLIKSKILCGFLSVVENKYWQRSFVKSKVM